MARLFPLRRFARSDRGASMVEFAILLPMLILLLAVIIEGGRMMWSYQTVAAGVRDATRYLGRIAPANACDSGVGLPATVGGQNLQDKLQLIVVASLNGTSVRPIGMTVTVLPPELDCTNVGTYRISPAPVAVVRATATITFPFGTLFQAFGGPALQTVTTTITDRTRVFGS